MPEKTKPTWQERLSHLLLLDDPGNYECSSDACEGLIEALDADLDSDGHQEASEMIEDWFTYETRFAE